MFRLSLSHFNVTSTAPSLPMFRLCRRKVASFNNSLLPNLSCFFSTKSRGNHQEHRGGQLGRSLFRDPARDDNFEWFHWDRHLETTRHFRHLSILPWASTFKRLLWPDLSMVTCVATFATWYNCFHAPITFPSAPFTITSTALGLLLVFRTNSSYQRYLEARSTWGTIVNSSRTIFRLSSSYLVQSLEYARNSSKEKETLAICAGSRKLHERIVTLTQSFNRVMIFHLNQTGDLDTKAITVKPRRLLSDKRIKADTYAPQIKVEEKDASGDARSRALRQMLIELLGREEGEQIYIASQNGTIKHLPHHILCLLSQSIARIELFSHSHPSPSSSAGEYPLNLRLGMDPLFIHRLDNEIIALERAIGVSERILRTPIPTSYTRHTSRFLFLWTSLLPFTLWPFCGVYGTIPASVLVAFGLLAIEDIGVCIEEPFRILPAWRYSKAIDQSIPSLEALLGAVRQ